MDANTTCSLVNVTPITSYNQIVSGGRLVDFSIAQPYTSASTVMIPNNNFSSFFSTYKKPSALANGAPSIVTGYLGYPLSSPDYRTSPLSQARFASIVQGMIAGGDICSSTDIYNTNVYTNSSALGGISLATLYLTLAKESLTDADKAKIHAHIDLLQNKNMKFYSFFVYEYCYYHTIYNTLLAQYFLEYASPSNTSMANIGALVTSSGMAVQLDATAAGQASRLDGIVNLMARVNSRLTDMRQLLVAMQVYYSSALTSFQAILADSSKKGSDRNVETSILALKNQYPEIKSIQDESVFRKGIMDYTGEKNRYSNILLGIYAFLNIAAVAVIFTIKE
jgi:hypothetical protein